MVEDRAADGLVDWYQGEIGFGAFAPNETALVVVDMQRAYCEPEGLFGQLVSAQQLDIFDYYFPRVWNVVVPNIATMLAFCRAQGNAVVYLSTNKLRSDGSDLPPLQRRCEIESVERWGVQTFPLAGSPGDAILDAIAPGSGDLVVRKATAGGFASSGLDSSLRALGVKTLLFTGQSTNQCVDATARVGADLGYNCVMVDDALVTTDHLSHHASLLTFARTFGKVRTTARILDEYPWTSWLSAYCEDA